MPLDQEPPQHHHLRPYRVQWFAIIVEKLATSVLAAPIVSSNQTHRYLPTGKTISPFVPPSDFAHSLTTAIHVPIEPANTPTDVESVKATIPALPATTASREINNHQPDNVNSYLIHLPVTCASPIDTDSLTKYLESHPDRDLVSFLIDGFTYGFDILYRGPVIVTRPNNLKSARDHRAEVEFSLLREVSRGHSVGPFPSPPFRNFHCSPLGAVPKSDNSYRLILDLSSPRGFSINDGIDPELVTVRYSRFDDAIDLVRAYGATCFMSKIDIQSAFRLCPVRPVDWPLLGYSWGNGFYFDTHLPFGCRSSPFIFNSFADAIWWILINVVGVASVIHYLDDFFLCNISKNTCKSDMDKILTVFRELGIPVAFDKLVGPAQVITYLGIQIDTYNNTITLPADKFKKLTQSLQSWSKRKKCSKRELLSLIGQLAFAAKVVKQSRFFLRRLINLSTKVRALNHRISLNEEARSDINWWIKLLPFWQGTTKIQDAPISADMLALFTDASGSLGFGAVFGSSWISCPWPENFKLIDDINYKELFALVAAVFSWSDHLLNRQIILFTDNLNVANIWLKGSSSSSLIMDLIRKFFLFTAKNNINVLIQHVPGHFNKSADYLSRLQVAQFKRLNPNADPTPTEVSHLVWSL